MHMKTTRYASDKQRFWSMTILNIGQNIEREEYIITVRESFTNVIPMGIDLFLCIE